MPYSEPYKLSPVHRALEKLGARWSHTGAWRTVETFSSTEEELRTITSTAAICDLSHYGKIELRGLHVDKVDRLPAIGSARAAGSKYIYRFTHEQVLVCAADEAQLSGLISQQWEGACVHTTNRTSGFACFLLAGPKSTEILNRLCSLDLRDSHFPDLSCACAPIARVNAWMIRRDRNSIRAYEVLVGREYGDYLWNAIWDTGQSFGIRPFGLKTLTALEG